MMYGSQVLCKDDRIQLAGYVHVMFAHGMQSDLSSDHDLLRSKEMMSVRSCLPVRCVAKHFCYHNKNIEQSLYGVLVHALDPFQAIRFRLHYGTIKECIYNLMTYGIVHETIPILYKINPDGSPSTADDDFEIDTEFNLAFIEALSEREEQDRQRAAKSIADDETKAITLVPQTSQQQRKQQKPRTKRQQHSADEYSGGVGGDTNSTTNNAQDTVILPGPFDIIMGRGCHNKNKPGNARLKTLLESYRDRYDSMQSKNEKTVLIQTILKHVDESGSRFLIQDKDTPGMWTIAAHAKAHDKIAHDFRNMRRNKATTWNTIVYGGVIMMTCVGTSTSR